jgi:hypothetical protein
LLDLDLFEISVKCQKRHTHPEARGDSSVRIAGGNSVN